MNIWSFYPLDIAPWLQYALYYNVRQSIGFIESPQAHQQQNCLSETPTTPADTVSNDFSHLKTTDTSLDKSPSAILAPRFKINTIK